MRITSIGSLLGLVALGASGLLAGCGDDEEAPTKSGVAESCQTTADCADGLKCLQGACYQNAGDSNAGGDTGSVGPAPAVLSGLNESCNRRADCEDGLGCFNSHCVDPADGAGGGPSVARGGVGETCALTSDCEKGLTCQPQRNGLGAQSVCAVLDTELESTGKDCHAECVQASDCCELPIAYQQPYDFTYYGTGANSCAKLKSLLTGVNCATTILGADLARCFAADTFCNCAADTWSCDEMGACVYATECSVSGSLPGGCPVYSRSGRVLSSACSVDGTCGTAAPPSCTTDASCVGKTVADSPLETCVTGECTCYQETACYRRCDADLDCAKGRLCSDAKVCVAAPQCTMDSQCAVLTGDYRYTCDVATGTCSKPCETDLDCNPAGLTGGLNMLCNADQKCEAVGCTENDDCPAGAGGVKMFCSKKLVAAPGDNVASAITD